MSTKFKNWLLLVLLSLIWGSSFILMKRGLEVFTSAQVAALRVFIGFLVLSPLIFRHVKKAMLKHWKPFLALGLLGSLIPAFLFAEAQMGISSSLAAMLNSLTPLFTLLIGVILYRNKTRMLNVVGVIIGFLGAIGLLMMKGSGDSDTRIVFGIYVIIGAICNAFVINIIKKHLAGVNAITCTVWSLMFVGPIAGLYLFTTDFAFRLATNPLAIQSLGYVGLLATFGSAISIILFNILVGNSTTLFASSVTYLIPVVAIMWGFVDDEVVLPLHLFWISIVLSGVYLVNKKPDTALTMAMDDL